jgi:hypothetical protein
MSSSQGLSQSQFDKKLSDIAQTRLRQSISNSGFFQAEGIYPPNPDGSQDYTLGVLGITMDSKSHTAIWVYTFSNIPTGATGAEFCRENTRRYSLQIIAQL